MSDLDQLTDEDIELIIEALDNLIPNYMNARQYITAVTQRVEQIKAKLKLEES